MMEKFLYEMIAYLLNSVFTVYTLMLFVRVFGSWFPSFAQTRFMGFVAFYTDPYMNIFRKIIPPLGMIDISPLFAFMGLQFLQWFVLSVFK